MDFRLGGNAWGVHRVIQPHGGLPQAALKLDATLPPYDNEILVSLRRLQIDAASFRQLDEKHLSLRGLKGRSNPVEIAEPVLSVATGSPAAPRNDIAYKIYQIVAERGKMHNPVTNSGGVFLGKVSFVGPRHPLKKELKEGSEVISLVSLTLTPLTLEKISEVNTARDTVDATGHAIVFESGMVKKMPEDFNEGVALAALDVCGAPAQVKRLVRPGEKVLVIGLGKAGKTVAAMAHEMGGTVYGVDEDAKAVDWCAKNIPGHFAQINATAVQDVTGWVQTETRKSLVDVAVLATNIADTEMSAILPCRNGGRALFFGMQTSFQKVVLGAEGVGKDIQLLMGSGYVPGHADLMLNLLRNHKPLREWFEEKFT